VKINCNIAVSAALFSLVLASGASASTVFSESLETPFPTGQYSVAGGQQEASEFTLSANTQITSATFYGALYGGGSFPSIYKIQLFSSVNNKPFAEVYSANSPGAAVSSGVTDNHGANVFAITSSFTPFTALAGIPYFFSASDVAGSSYNFLVASSGTGVGVQTQGGVAGYYALPHGEAFSLAANAAVVAGIPEPSSWALMLVGFGGLGAVLRRRRVRVALTA
jgi:hypothetical protein